MYSVQQSKFKIRFQFFILNLLKSNPITNPIQLPNILDIRMNEWYIVRYDVIMCTVCTYIIYNTVQCKNPDSMNLYVIQVKNNFEICKIWSQVKFIYGILS